LERGEFRSDFRQALIPAFVAFVNFCSTAFDCSVRLLDVEAILASSTVAA